MEKTVFFTFTGELLCFGHVLFNAEDMLKKGHDVKIVIEGKSCSLIPFLGSDENTFKQIYVSLKGRGDIISVCQACAHKMGTLDSAKKEGLKLENSLYGHPSMEEYMAKGYRVVTV